VHRRGAALIVEVKWIKPPNLAPKRIRGGHAHTAIPHGYSNQAAFAVMQNTWAARSEQRLEHFH
jgi:hypothetical protein